MQPQCRCGLSVCKAATPQIDVGHTPRMMRSGRRPRTWTRTKLGWQAAKRMAANKTVPEHYAPQRSDGRRPREWRPAGHNEFVPHKQKSHLTTILTKHARRFVHLNFCQLSTLCSFCRPMPNIQTATQQIDVGHSQDANNISMQTNWMQTNSIKHLC